MKSRTRQGLKVEDYQETNNLRRGSQSDELIKEARWASFQLLEYHRIQARSRVIERTAGTIDARERFGESRGYEFPSALYILSQLYHQKERIRRGTLMNGEGKKSGGFAVLFRPHVLKMLVPCAVTAAS